MTASLTELIGQSFGLEAASRWDGFVPSERQLETLANVGLQVLSCFPGRPPGACALMSAAYSLFLEGQGAPPGYVVVGSLFVGSVRVFGADKAVDGAAAFSQSNLSWDGHAWIVFGDHLADVSLFRTADSGQAHRALSDYVHAAFGRGRGLMICPTDDTGSLRYQPEYVLRQDQVDAIGRGAREWIVGGTP